METYLDLLAFERFGHGECESLELSVLLRLSLVILVQAFLLELEQRTVIDDLRINDSAFPAH